MSQLLWRMKLAREQWRLSSVSGNSFTVEDIFVTLLMSFHCEQFELEHIKLTAEGWSRSDVGPKIALACARLYQQRWPKVSLAINIVMSTLVTSRV